MITLAEMAASYRNDRIRAALWLPDDAYDELLTIVEKNDVPEPVSISAVKAELDRLSITARKLLAMPGVVDALLETIKDSD